MCTDGFAIMLLRIPLQVEANRFDEEDKNIRKNIYVNSMVMCNDELNE